MNMYVIQEVTGLYFVNPSYESWEFTDNIDEATKFTSIRDANRMRRILEKACVSTYWDYDDIIPYPTVIQIIK